MLWDPFDPSWSISRCSGTHLIPVGASVDDVGPIWSQLERQWILWDPYDPSWSISGCCGTHLITAERIETRDVLLQQFAGFGWGWTAVFIWRTEETKDIFANSGSKTLWMPQDVMVYIVYNKTGLRVGVGMRHWNCNVYVFVCVPFMQHSGIMLAYTHWPVLQSPSYVSTELTANTC